MPTPSRIIDLLEEALTTERLPEDICESCPELLEELRRQMRLCAHLDSRIDHLFPTSDSARSEDDTVNVPEIDGYVISGVLGRGGAGIVYRAQQIALDRGVAIKMLLTGRYGARSELHRLSREARAIGKLRHPNIVQVYDVGSVAAQPYFTMELVEHGTLAKHLQGRALEPLRAATLIVTLAEAMEAVHRMGIVHRDLKPSNILMTADGMPKIADFGLARHFDDDFAIPTLSAHVGTPSYMAPEQVRGTPDATSPLVDVYALGAILYECLSGRPPFQGATSAVTQQLVLSTDPIPLLRTNPKVPRDLQTICLKCLCKSGVQRYSSAAELAADVRRFLSNEPILARPTKRLERTWKWARRHPAYATALVASVTVLVGGWIALHRFKSIQQDRQRAIEADLIDVASYESREQWSSARQTIQRDIDSISGTYLDGMEPRLRSAQRDLELIAQLDAIHLERVTGGNLPIYRIKADRRYRNAFYEYLALKVGDPIATAAGTINHSAVNKLLAVAVTDWTISATTASDRRWLLELSQIVQPVDRDGWNKRICDPDRWASPSELKELARNIRVDRVSTSVLLILAERLKSSGAASAVEFLRRVQRENPSDFWVNLQLGTDMLWQNPNMAEAFCRAALAKRPDAAVGYTALADALRNESHPYDAIGAYLKALQLDPASAWTRNNCGNALADIGRFHEAMTFHDRAILDDPQYSWADYDAGNTLMKMRRANEAALRYQKAVNSSLEDLQSQRNWRAALIVGGRADEALLSWQKAIGSDAPGYEIAAGYAELCAYLNRQYEYESARKNLLKLADLNSDGMANLQSNISACLLEPAADATLSEISDLLARNPVARTAKPTSVYARYRFNQSLLAYRQHRASDAIQLLRGSEHEALGSSTRILLAMAQFDIGDIQQAKDTLADVSFHYDWRPINISSADFGKYHVLRREAEAKLMPGIHELLASQTDPSERFDRLILIGACNEKGMSSFAAKLYSQAFQVEPQLGKKPGLTVRFQGACAAVASGEALRRAQALTWLTDDLALNVANMPAPGSLASAQFEEQLGRWQTDPDLAAVRKAVALDKLPDPEHRAWLAFWREVANTMDHLDELNLPNGN